MERIVKKGRWSKEEVKFLEENFEKLTNPEIAKSLGRSIDSVERKMYRLGYKKTNTPYTIDDMVGAEKEAEKKRQTDRLLKELVKEKAGTEIVVDILSDVIPMANFKPKPFKPVRDKKKEEVIMICLSDVHVGRYSATSLERKMNELYKGVIKVTEIHRSAYPVNELVINFIGDLLDGDGIFPAQTYEQKFYLMEQMFTYGLPMMTNLINQLSNHFEKVTIYATPGNHGRVNKYTDRELNYDTIFAEAMKIATQNNPRLEWHITWDWYQVANIMGWGFLLTHGANIRTWMNLPFYGMKEKGMRWQGSLPEKWNYLIMGHFHSILAFRWNNFKAYVNGTWLDNDDFALRELGMDSTTAQLLIGINKKYGTTWHYEIKLDNGK